MLVRIATALLAVVVGSTPAALPPDPAPAASVQAVPAANPAPAGPGLERRLWPYPKACLETELQRAVGYLDDENSAVDITSILGVSRPCPGNRAPVKGVRLALTQYHVVTKGVYAGWMGTPWRTNSIGETRFRRLGIVPHSLSVLCLSTGLEVRPGGVFAEHNRCFRPIWDRAMSDWAAEDVPVDDPSVNVALRRLPTPGESAPAGCENCLVTDPVAALPTPVQLPYPGTVGLGCARLRLDPAGAAEDLSVRIAGTIQACGGDTLADLSVSIVYYGERGGKLSSQWRLTGTHVAEVDRVVGLSPDDEAICLVSGRQQTDDGSFARQLACWATRTDAQGRSHVVRIPTGDPLVHKPVEIVATGDPPGTCITCL